MGGSGSNAAGYECTGTYTFDGRHYTEGVPGLVFHPAGTTVRGIVVRLGSRSVLDAPDGGGTSRRRRPGCVLPAVVLVVTLAGRGLARGDGPGGAVRRDRPGRRGDPSCRPRYGDAWPLIRTSPRCRSG